MTATTQDSPPVGADTVRPTIAPRTMLNKVPEVTLYFWIIKILCTTVGETAADYLARQPRARPHGHDLRDERRSRRLAGGPVPHRRYVPGIYWLAVVLISIVGTLITDNLTDNFGISARPDDYCLQHRPRTHLRRLVPERTNALDPHDRHDKERGVLLARRPLHLRTRDRRRRSGRRTLRHRLPGNRRCCSAPLIAVVYVAHVRFGLNAVLAFWIAYILTRPLGASIGDYLSQPQADGGLGLGTTVTSVLFLDHDPCRCRLSHHHQERPDRERT